MFFRGFLIGLVAGVWLTVIYLVIATRGQAIRAYFESLGRSAEPAPARQTKEAASSPVASHLRTATDSAATATQVAGLSQDRRLDPAQLSAHGAPSYERLIRLTHDEPTAQRLVYHEAKRQPDADIDELIDRAIASLLHDRL